MLLPLEVSFPSSKRELTQMLRHPELRLLFGTVSDRPAGNSKDVELHILMACAVSLHLRGVAGFSCGPLPPPLALLWDRVIARPSLGVTLEGQYFP